MTKIAKTEDTEIDKFDGAVDPSDNETVDDLLSLVAKNAAANRHRKRSTSLPFIENNGDFKGLIAVKQTADPDAFQAPTENGCHTRKRMESKCTSNDQRPTRRSSSMPELEGKNSQFHHRRSGNAKSKPRIKDLDVPCRPPKCEDALKLPTVISRRTAASSVLRCGTHGQANGNETDLDSQEIKLERKIYLPRINSKKGNIFM